MMRQREAGADHVGFDDYIKKIQEGWTDIDVIIAAPDTMESKIGKVLGPRGFVKSKSGTVTPNVGQAVKRSEGG